MLASVSSPTISCRGRITSRTMRRRRSSAFSTMSRPKPRRAGMPLRTAEQQPQFLLRMRRAPSSLAVWMPNCRKQPLRRMVQQPDERIRQPREPRQRLRRPQRHRQRLADGHRLGRQFADDDQQKTVDEKAGHDRHRVPHRQRLHVQPAEHRRQQRLEHRFHQHAQAQARQRDAELDGADGRVQVLDEPPHDFRAAMPLERPAFPPACRGFSPAPVPPRRKIRSSAPAPARRGAAIDWTSASPCYKRTSPKMTLRMSCKLTMPDLAPVAAQHNRPAAGRCAASVSTPLPAACPPPHKARASGNPPPFLPRSSPAGTAPRAGSGCRRPGAGRPRHATPAGATDFFRCDSLSASRIGVCRSSPSPTLSMGIVDVAHGDVLQIEHAIDHRALLGSQSLRGFLHEQAHLLAAAEKMAGERLAARPAQTGRRTIWS